MFVVIHFETLELIEKSYAISEMRFPYIPGLLSFREIPALIEAWKHLRVDPDVIVADGQGIAHPSRLGIASHLGLFLNRPTIGCAKNRLVGQFSELAPEAGATSPLIHQHQIVGTVLRTKTRTHPSSSLICESGSKRTQLGSSSLI